MVVVLILNILLMSKQVEASECLRSNNHWLTFLQCFHRKLSNKVLCMKMYVHNVYLESYAKRWSHSKLLLHLLYPDDTNHQRPDLQSQLPLQKLRFYMVRCRQHRVRHEQMAKFQMLWNKWRNTLNFFPIAGSEV